MNRNTNNIQLTAGNWRQGSGAYAPNNNYWNRMHDLPVGAATYGSGGAQDPWWSFEERLMTGPLGLASFPASGQIFGGMSRSSNSRTISSIPEAESLPRLNMQVPTPEAESKLTQDEQKAVLKKLKKEIYNPTPKKITKRLNLYYRDNNAGKSSIDNDDEDGKRCAICLEDFEPKQLVMLTPCSHMFHEECIVPWVKSHGQCPVCRFAICERMRSESAVLSLNNTNPIMAADHRFAGQLISIIGDMEEAFEWGNVRPSR